MTFSIVSRQSGDWRSRELQETREEFLERQSALISSIPPIPKTSESAIFHAQILRPLIAARKISSSAAGKIRPKASSHRVEDSSLGHFSASIPINTPAGKKTSVK
jgi:hypothetical protein